MITNSEAIQEQLVLANQAAWLRGKFSKSLPKEFLFRADEALCEFMIDPKKTNLPGGFSMNSTDLIAVIDDLNRLLLKASEENPQNFVAMRLAQAWSAHFQKVLHKTSLARLAAEAAPIDAGSKP